MIPHRPLSADTPETTITLTLYPIYITDWIYQTRSNPHGRSATTGGPKAGAPVTAGWCPGPASAQMPPPSHPAPG